MSRPSPALGALPDRPSGPATIAVVIVNWNGAAHLDECLRSLQAQTLRERLEVIVIDNASTDESLRLIEGYVPSAAVIVNESNRGFAAGCNQGIRASAGEFVALLNNDAVVEPTWLEELVGAMGREPRAGICTSKVLAYGDRRLIDNAGHVVYADGLTRGRGRLELDRGQFEHPEEVFCGSGCAALLRRAMLDDVGLFDEAFFAYCEDADLGFRARLRGWSCWYVPSAVAYHKFSASSEAFSPFKALHVERNRLWLAVKNLPGPLLLLSPLFTLARYGWQAYGALAGRGASGRFVQQRSRADLAAILAQAYLQAWRGLPNALAQRRRIQAGRRASLWQVVGWLRRHGTTARQIALLE